MYKEKKVFISHSSKDAIYVEQLIELLEGIGVASHQIFCSSFDGYGINLGENFLDVLKKELNNNVLVIFVLTSNFYRSPISLCEMGATWVKTNEHIPILIPPFEYNQIKGVIPLTQGMMINEKLKLNSLKEKIESFLDIEPKNISAWERKRDSVLKIINNFLVEKNEEKKDVIHSKINSNSSIEVPENILGIIKKKAGKEWPDDYDMQLHIIQSQSKAYNILRYSPPDDIPSDKFNSIYSKAKKEWPNDFEMQLHIVKEQVQNYKKLQNI